MTMMVSRRSPLYGNCIVFNQEGTAIFRCSMKTCEWYITRGLAEWRVKPTEVQENKYASITLTFKAKGNGYATDDFYMQWRDNKCVVCGSTDELIREYVVPHSLRTWFPKLLKNSSHFDILPSCLTCHNKYSVFRDRLLREMCFMHRVPYNGLWPTKAAHTARLKARAAANVLVHHGGSGKLPSDRVIVLVGHILKTNPGLDLTNPLAIKTVAEAQVPKALVESGPQLLVNSVSILGRTESEKALLITKAIIWPFRCNFLATMQPKHMPAHWNPERMLR